MKTRKTNSYLHFLSGLFSFAFLVFLLTITRNTIYPQTILMCYLMIHWTAYLWIKTIYNKGYLETLPWLEIWDSVFATSYAISIFLMPNMPADRAVYLVSLSLAAFAGFNIAYLRTSFAEKASPFSGAKFPRGIAFPIAISIFMGLALFRLSGVWGVFAQFYFLFENIFKIFALLALYEAFLGHGHTFKLLMAILCAACFFVFSIGLELGDTILFAITAFLMYFIAKRKNPVKVGIIGLLLILFLNPSKFELRTEHKKGQITSKTQLMSEYIKRGTAYWKDFFDYENKDFADQLWKSGLYRLAYIGELDIIVNKTPAQVDYYRGKWWLRSLQIAIIPKLFWTEKPDFHEYIRQYMMDFRGRKTTEEKGAHINQGFVGDLYLNFGPWGCFLCAIFFGAITGYLARLLNQKGVDMIYQLIFFVIIPPTTFDPRNYFSNRLYFILIAVIFTLFLQRVFKWLEQKTT